ncbi:MAG: DUF5060 domain-containing protein [Planctomycetes bacterium]|nr:DUF5060 domain-containing protein [Planctomycetota bacterium]
MRLPTTIVLILGFTTGWASPLPAQVWPGAEWAAASPTSQGMSRECLDEAAAYAERHGGGSGCIVRHGFLVKEWGDPKRLADLADIKSATKGSAGTTLLGLAVDRGLVALDDLARAHYPRLGAEKPENLKRLDWLERITVRHLATMTAGFDDGRPPVLAYEPGTRGIYSNDGSNMLAELLTLGFREDLRAVLEREVMGPIGVRPSEWAWRENAYRSRTIEGLPSREFASGITITHRGLARIGYLYLRGGEWNGRRILSRAFLREATRPTELPAFVPYYAFFWGSNARGTYPGMPRDAFWALGLGDSFAVVCPSLDLVAVRLGAGSTRSQLPGGDELEAWGRRVEGFFQLVARAVRDPCPRSPVIASLAWAPPEAIVRKAKGSDNWPLTWADDGHLYAAYGDGSGFEPFVPEKLSLGFARIEGGPGNFRGINLRSPSGEQRGDGAAGVKASGLLMVDGILYLWTRNAGDARLAWSTDRGGSWTWADWRLEGTFGCPTILNFGKDYAGARDEHVYVYSHDSRSAYEPADRMVLARAPKARIRERDAYELFVALDAGGRPLWTRDIRERGAVFTHAGKCWRSTVSYDAGLKRYLWCQTLPGEDPRTAGGFGIYDAPEPWGPWTTVTYTESWDVGPGETSGIPTKWMSEDGRTFHLVFSGDDSFSVRRATATLAPAKDLGSLGRFAKWARVEVVLKGPDSRGRGTPNPFRLKLDGAFVSPGGKTWRVPGFYDGDGAGGLDGSVWKLRFSADEAGRWTFETASPEDRLDGWTGSFVVIPQPEDAPGFWRWGRLEHAGTAEDRIRYLKLRDGPYWLKAGCDDPESFLGRFQHYDTQAERAAAVDYLAERGINSLYMMVHNVGGDEDDVWPWLGGTSAEAKLHAGADARFDVARLEEWRALFEHMQARGVVPYLVLEDDSAWTGYDHERLYREVVARFGYLPALLFNIGEEHNENHPLEVGLERARRLEEIDPYGHPRGIHNVNRPLDAYADALQVDFTAIQTGSPGARRTREAALGHNAIAIDWIRRCEARGRRVLMAGFDEGRPELDRSAWWSAYLGGGVWEAHVLEPYDRPPAAWEPVWTELGGARALLESVPFWEMAPDNSLVKAGEAFCLARPGSAYALYLPSGGTVAVELAPGGTYEHAWWSPANGRGGRFQDPGRVSGGEQRFTAPGPGDWALRIVRASAGRGGAEQRPREPRGGGGARP